MKFPSFKLRSKILAKTIGFLHGGLVIITMIKEGLPSLLKSVFQLVLYTSSSRSSQLGGHSLWEMFFIWMGGNGEREGSGCGDSRRRE